MGSIRQLGGKWIHAWAFEGDCAEGWCVRSNQFSMEWPPRSGRQVAFPEIDRAEFFPLPEARQRLKEAQFPLLERAAAVVSRRSGVPASEP